MREPVTPLGFIPGDVDTGTHCMFVFPKRDTTFYERVSGYVSAGLDSGEMCVCVCPRTGPSMPDQLRSFGLDVDSAVSAGQLAVYGADSIYSSENGFGLGRVMDFWTEQINTAQRRWKGIRIFGDGDYAHGSRSIRLKMLEYESKVNLATPQISIALCGYQSNSVPRALLTQLQSVHPFVASIRSIKRNNRYIEPARFLSSFYRFQRISRVYPASPRYGQECRRHFEEVAARTPMTLHEIDDMKLALGEAFANAVQHGCDGLSENRRHVHVCFMPQPAGFVIEVRDHGPGFALPPDDEPALHDQPGSRGLILMRNLVHDLYVDRRKSDTVVTLHTAYASPYRN